MTHQVKVTYEYHLFRHAVAAADDKKLGELMADDWEIVEFSATQSGNEAVALILMARLCSGVGHDAPGEGSPAQRRQR